MFSFQNCVSCRVPNFQHSRSNAERGFEETTSAREATAAAAAAATSRTAARGRQQQQQRKQQQELLRKSRKSVFFVAQKNWRFLEAEQEWWLEQIGREAGRGRSHRKAKLPPYDGCRGSGSCSGRPGPVRNFSVSSHCRQRRADIPEKKVQWSLQVIRIR